MAATLHRFSFHANDVEEGEERPRRTAFRGVRAEPPSEADVDAGFNSDEAAARFHLTSVLESDRRPAVRGVTAPDRAELVPNLRLVDTQEFPQTQTRLLRFEQTHGRIPVFGAQAVCELDEDRGMVSAEGQLGDVEGVSPIASLTPAEALKSIAAFTGTDVRTLERGDAPELNFFQSPESGAWHLVYYFRRVPAAREEVVEHTRGHGLGPSPRERRPLVDYLVDAHDGRIVYYFSATPLLDIPSQCYGIDEEGTKVTFWGQRSNGEFRMRDPLREIATYDIELGDLENAVVTTPVPSASADYGDLRKAAVSAHANATKVHNFFNSVLFRDGIDNKGMTLINIVNCTYPAEEEPPSWRNAVWYDDRMWYGQAVDTSGRLVSFSRFLDVIAHELTHGVTEYSAGLVYRDQSGALNESFSDIFGIMVANWDFSREDGGDVSTWDWELGAGLGRNGGPLRDLSDPSRTGDPDHTDNYLETAEDSGGVHTNSNIHNKAAYNLLAAVDAQGKRALTPRDVAYLYYLCLSRLSRLATFSDVLAGLVSVASTLYAGNEAERDTKVAVITEAYRAVGIDGLEPESS